MVTLAISSNVSSVTETAPPVDEPVAPPPSTLTPTNWPVSATSAASDLRRQLPSSLHSKPPTPPYPSPFYTLLVCQITLHCLWQLSVCGRWPARQQRWPHLVYSWIRWTGPLDAVLPVPPPVLPDCPTESAKNRSSRKHVVGEKQATLC